MRPHFPETSPSSDNLCNKREANPRVLRIRVSLNLFAFALMAAMAVRAQAVPGEFLQNLHWRLIGPFRGGRAVAAAGIPGEPNTFYFGSVEGGVWKTTNAGQTWAPIFDSEPTASVGAIAVAPSSPDVIYVGTGESDIRSTLSSGDGVYKSTDAGKTWKNIGLRETRQISKIVIDPHDPNVAYVAALGHVYGPNQERGVFETTDGGQTWKQVLSKGPEIGAADLAMAEANPRILFAAMWKTWRPPWSTYAPINGPGSGLYRSTDGGGSWTELKGNGLPGGDWGRVGVGVSPDGKRVYALIDVKPGAGLYRSDDGGDTWTLANGDPRLTSRAWYFNWLAIDPKNADVVYVANVALLRSEDGGKTITVLKGEPGGDDYHNLWIDPNNPSRLLLVSDQGANVSVDRGATWSSWYNQPTAQLYRLATDNSFPYWVLASQQDSGAIGVASRSNHGVLSAQDMVPVNGSESGAIAVDPNDNNIFYITSSYGGVSRMNRQTSFSQDISPWPMPMWGTEIDQRKYRAPWTPPLIFSPADKKTLYMGTQYLLKTTDGGLHWTQISPDLTGAKPQAGDTKTKPTVENSVALGYGVIYTIAPSSLNANVIWAGSDTGLIHLTRDGGKTWRDATPPGLSGWSKISTIEASHYEPGEAFAAVDRHRLDDQRPYLYRTRDFGKTWQPIAAGIGEAAFVRVVREDIRKQGLLFAGTELGVYVSFDDGDVWQPLQLNLPVSSVQDVQVKDDDLVIATHGRSMWILDDISQLRQMDPHAISANAWLFQPAWAYRIDKDLFMGTPLPPEEPQAKNPPDGAIVDYYLKSASTDLTLEILDGSGKVVRRYGNREKPHKHMELPIAEEWFPEPVRLESSAGMHRFVWDLRYASSGDSDAEDTSDEPTAPKGPRVPPGTYQVRLMVGRQALTQKVDVKMDPRSPATPQQLAQQYETGREMYGATMKSRQALAEVKSVQAQLDGLNKEAAEKPGVLTELSSVQASIKKLLTGDEQALGLESANSGLNGALRVVASSDRGIPAQAIELYRQCNAAVQTRSDEWRRLKSSDLFQLNRDLQKAGLAPLKVAEIEEEVEYLMTR